MGQGSAGHGHAESAVMMRGVPDAEQAPPPSLRRSPWKQMFGPLCSNQCGEGASAVAAGGATPQTFPCP
eukprot:4253064-Alexandrium_andersonii.AAC.1